MSFSVLGSRQSPPAAPSAWQSSPLKEHWASVFLTVWISLRSFSLCLCVVCGMLSSECGYPRVNMRVNTSVNTRRLEEAARCLTALPFLSALRQCPSLTWKLASRLAVWSSELLGSSCLCCLSWGPASSLVLLLSRLLSQSSHLD